MGTVCKDTAIRSSVVPSAAFYPKRHHHHRRCLTAFAKFCADHLLREKKKEENRKKTECIEGLPLALVSAVKRVDSVSFENDEIFNVKSDVVAWTSKLPRVSPRSYMRSEGLTKVGHEADNRDIQKNEKNGRLFSPFNTLITPPQINRSSNIPPQHPR